MSKADKLFVHMCSEIIDNGTNDYKANVRPKWEDGTPAHTIRKFGVVNRYDLREEFPALTLRRTAIKSAVDEVLWIYQRKSNNINDLNSHIWDQWADKKGSIGKAYGYQIGLRNIWRDDIHTRLDQMDNVLYTLKHDPFSRRIMTNMMNMGDLHEMALHPCCWSCTFNVTDEGEDKLVLNMVLNQRSQDTLAANNWNVVQYAVLLMMVAQVSNMIPGVLLHVIADAHIYDRHIPLVKELISRPQYEAPTVTLDPDIKNFYDFTPESFLVENYNFGPQIKNIPIAE